MDEWQRLMDRRNGRMEKWEGWREGWTEDRASLQVGTQLGDIPAPCVPKQEKHKISLTIFVMWVVFCFGLGWVFFVRLCVLLGFYFLFFFPPR